MEGKTLVFTCVMSIVYCMLDINQTLLCVRNVASPSSVPFCISGSQEWTCTSFDYCASQQMCMIARPATNGQPVSLLNNTNCDHYSRSFEFVNVFVVHILCVWTLVSWPVAHAAQTGMNRRMYRHSRLFCV